jgi:heme-degrading monooxygenase HmoA
MSEHVILWEFRVRAGREADFESAYRPDGAWAKLFVWGDGYIGTQLLRNAADPRRYITVDRWATADAFARFRADHAAEYGALDAKCADWTEAENELDSWVTV